MGFGVAASVRVGNALGAGNVEQAVAAGKVSVICACKKEMHPYRPPSIHRKLTYSTVNAASSHVRTL